MKTNRKTAAMLLMVVHLITGIACTKDTISAPKNEIVDEGSLIMAENPPITRRCRVVKRYRAKGEVYRILVNTPNTSNTLGGTVAVSFAASDASLKAPDGTLVATPIKSQGRNGKEIEVETPEFELGGNVAGKTLTIRLKARNREGKVEDVVYYEVPLGPESKQPVTYEGKVAERPIADAIRIGLTASKEGTPSVEKGTLDVSIAIANDRAEDIKAVQLFVKPIFGKLALSTNALTIKPSRFEKGLHLFSMPAAIGFEGNLKDASVQAELLIINSKNELQFLTVKEVKELADILKED